MAPAPASSDLETALWAQGFKQVAGVDEAGRGALAGPLVAAAVILRADRLPRNLSDSKQLTPSRREELYVRIIDMALAYNIFAVSHDEIDEFGVHHANLTALRQAVAGLATPADYILSDGYAVPDAPCPSLAVPKGDAVSVSVAAASILAKVRRDRLMCELDGAHPQYGFAGHKGYGTAEHLKALTTHGPCALHRRSFQPVAEAET